MISSALTGGGDGVVALHESINGQLATQSQRRIHKGPVTVLLRVSESQFCSASEDGTIYAVSRNEEDGTLNARLLYRGTLPLRVLAHEPQHNLVACSGDEQKVIILDGDGGQLKWSSSILKKNIVAVAWHRCCLVKDCVSLFSRIVIDYCRFKWEVGRSFGV